MICWRSDFLFRISNGWFQMSKGLQNISETTSGRCKKKRRLRDVWHESMSSAPTHNENYIILIVNNLCIKEKSTQKDLRVKLSLYFETENIYITSSLSYFSFCVTISTRSQSICHVFKIVWWPHQIDQREKFALFNGVIKYEYAELLLFPLRNFLTTGHPTHIAT